MGKCNLNTFEKALPTNSNKNSKVQKNIVLYFHWQHVFFFFFISVEHKKSVCLIIWAFHFVETFLAPKINTLHRECLQQMSDNNDG